MLKSVKSALVVFAAMSALVASVASAAPTYYVGASLGVSEYAMDESIAAPATVNEKAAYSIRGGAEWDVMDKVKLGAEVSYFRTAANISMGTPYKIGVANNGVGLAAVARYAVMDPIDVFVKFGVIRGRGTVTYAPLADYASYDNAFQTTLGGSYHFTKNIAMTLDYTRVNTTPSLKASAYSAGLEYRF